MKSFDRRLTPARPDLAADHLAGKVEAARFAAGWSMRVSAPVADLKCAPAPDAALDTQALYGEEVTVYEVEEGWAWAQLASDSYVGYLPAVALIPLAGAAATAPTHRIGVRASFVYPAANMKAPPLAALPFQAAVCVVSASGDFARLSDGGFVFASHLQPIDAMAADFVAIAEGMIGAPYLWGGKTPAGIDCSGLVQLSLAAAGVAAPRDTDMQASALGLDFPLTEDGQGGLKNLSRGDLVFWKGHVGVMQNADTLLHANGHHMLVASEPLAQARSRIAAKSFGAITAIRRLCL